MKRLLLGGALTLGLFPLGLFVAGRPARAVFESATHEDVETISLAILVAVILFASGVLIAGLLEGVLVSRLFRLPLGRSTVVIVLGNIVLGCAVVAGLVLGEPLRIMLGCLAAIVLDFIFLLRAMPAGPKRGVQAWEATALVQAATYAVMFVVLLSIGYPLG